MPGHAMHLRVHIQRYAMHCTALESTYAGVCDIMYLKVHMQKHAMQCTWKYICEGI